MDIEKAMEFILNAQANAEVQMAKMREDQARAWAAADARWAAADARRAEDDARRAEVDARAAERWAEADARRAEDDARAAKRWAEANARAAERDAEMARIDRTLRRAIHLGVREARNWRVRHKLLDEKITQLSAAQIVTEEKLQSFLDSLKRGRNGGPGGAS